THVLHAHRRVQGARALRDAPASRTGEAHLAGTPETGDTVAVPASLVVEHSSAEPDDVAHPEVVAHATLDVLARQPRIAIGVQQAFLGDQRRTLTVDVHGATFVHQRRANRKSTRLNSSHRTISYAVFCLKKK